MNRLLVAVSTLYLAAYTRVAEIKDKERGATATEYALLIALIAVVILVGVLAFGNALSGFFSTLGTTVTGWATAL
jgi:pilus assembly protein Flp/PilA